MQEAIHNRNLMFLPLSKVQTNTSSNTCFYGRSKKKTKLFSFIKSRAQIWKEFYKKGSKNCSYRCFWKVWSSVDQSRAACWSRQREDDTRFILESCEDTEGSRQWGKDKERPVRAVRECVSLFMRIARSVCFPLYACGSVGTWSWTCVW